MMMSSSNNNNNGNYRSVNGSLRESLVGGRNIPVGSQYHRRGHSLTGGGVFSKDTHNKDENLDLFSKNRRSLSVASSDESSDGMFWIFFLPVLFPEMPSVVFCVSCNSSMETLE
jgi:hypothetical protein